MAEYTGMYLVFSLIFHIPVKIFTKNPLQNRLDLISRNSREIFCTHATPLTSEHFTSLHFTTENWYINSQLNKWLRGVAWVQWYFCSPGLKILIKKYDVTSNHVPGSEPEQCTHAIPKI